MASAFNVHQLYLFLLWNHLRHTICCGHWSCSFSRWVHYHTVVRRTKLDAVDGICVQRGSTVLLYKFALYTNRSTTSSVWSLELQLLLTKLDGTSYIYTRRSDRYLLSVHDCILVAQHMPSIR